MGWSIGYDNYWKRDIGYGVPAYCDHPECNEQIDRGLSYVCGDAPYGGEHGCGLYFCSKHQEGEHQNCERCSRWLDPFNPKQEHPEWMQWKLTDESWEQWRNENPDEVAKYKALLKI